MPKLKSLFEYLLDNIFDIATILIAGFLVVRQQIQPSAIKDWLFGISHGTAIYEGSRAFSLLASVIETCRQRDVLPWPYLAEVIAARRKGNLAPTLPAIAL